MERVVPEKDQKLQDLLEIIKNKVENPINPNNKKIIIFSAFADTVNYLYTNLSTTCKNNL
jgi:ERCC4-related helicase